jgi:hypothetical protein
MIRLPIKRSIDPKAITQQRIVHLQGLLNDQNERLVRLNEESTKLSAIYTRLAHDAAGRAETRQAEMRRNEKVNEYVEAMARQRELVREIEEEKVIFDNLKTGVEADEKEMREKGPFAEGESGGSQNHDVKGTQSAREDSGQSSLGGRVDEHLVKHIDKLGQLGTVQAQHTKQLTEHGVKLAEHDIEIQGLKEASSSSQVKTDQESHENPPPRHDVVATKQSGEDGTSWGEESKPDTKNDQINKGGNSKVEAPKLKPKKDHDLGKPKDHTSQGFNVVTEGKEPSHENGPSPDKNDVAPVDTNQPKDETSKNDKPTAPISDTDLGHPPIEQPSVDPKNPSGSPAKESDDKNPLDTQDCEQYDQQLPPPKAAEESVNKDGTDNELVESSGEKKDASQSKPILSETKIFTQEVDERLNKVETKNDTPNNQVQEVDKTAKVEQYDLDITKILSTQDTHGEKIDSHGAKLEHHAQDIEHHDQKIQYHDQRIQKVESKTNEHGEKIWKLIETTTNNGQNLAVHDVHLDYHKDDIANLKQKADTQATTAASFEAQLCHNAEKLKEIDQVKHGLNDMGKQLVQYKSDVQHLCDRTQSLEKDIKKFEGNDERLKVLQSNVADYKRLITDVQAQQQYQTAQLLALKEKTEKPVMEAPPKGKVNIGLISGLGGGVIAIGALTAGAYIWWKKRIANQNAAKNIEEVSDAERATPAAAIITNVIEGEDKSGRRVRLPRVRGESRLHAREWHPDTTYNVHSFF